MTLRSVVLATALGGCALQAQIPASHVAESKQRYAAIRDNLHKAAEAMPEESYSFKPMPEIRSFGELMAHIADAQANICGAATGHPKPVGAAKKTSKADIVGALKESSSGCDAAFESMTEAVASEPAGMGSMKASRLGILEYNTGHDAEEYGYAAVYLRLKGVVPPTSAGRGR
ncbi:MAG: DinB family protein [Acidobacteriota bacterium]